MKRIRLIGLLMVGSLVVLSGCHLAFDDPYSDIRLCQDVGEAEIGESIIVTDARKGTTQGRFFADCEALHFSHFDCYGVWYDNHGIRYRYSNGDELCPI
jgi:hypothetical protein